MKASRAGLFVPFDSEFLRDQCDNRSGVLPTLKQRGAGNPGVGGGGGGGSYRCRCTWGTTL